jgi:hypothetical protein
MCARVMPRGWRAVVIGCGFASLFVGASAAWAATGNVSPRFLPPWTYDTGAGPAAVAVADVTGDGRNDLVVTNGFSSDSSAEAALVVFAQAADGSLDAPVRYTTSEDPAAVSNSRMGLAVGDLNGDSRADVAVATSAGVDVFIQSGGLLGERTLVPGTTDAQEVRLGDVNGDGRNDLVVTTKVPGSWPETGSVLLLLNTGWGFAVGTVFTGPYQQEVRLGDLTGDGRLDVAGYSGGGRPTSVYVLAQTASSSFTASTYASDAILPGSLALADVTGDGRLDLVLAEEGNGIDLRVWAQQPDGTLASPFMVYSHDSAAGLEAGDLDGDGKPDLVAYHAGGPADPVAGVGDWLVQPSGGLAPEVVSETGDVLDGLPPEGLAVGDLNGDGKNDVVYSSYNLGVTVLRQAGSDTSPPRSAISSGPENPTTTTSATFAFSASEPGVRFLCGLDSYGYRYCSSPITYTGIPYGAHGFYVRAVDAAGNVEPDPQRWIWVVETPGDHTPPTTTLDSFPPPTTSSAAATFTFHGTDPDDTTLSFTCSVDGGPYEPCVSPRTYTGLAPGSHQFWVGARDPAGNFSNVDGRYWTITNPGPGGPVNDDFASGQVLSGASGTVSADTTAATREVGEPTIIGNAGGRSLWYAWTAPASGSVTVDTHGSAFDTTLAVYTGSSLSGLGKLVENDDTSDTTSSVTFVATAGVSYRIQVDGYNGTSRPPWYGALKLNWRTA